jgi:hypothetical protein
MTMDVLARDAADLLRQPALLSRPLPRLAMIGDSITAANWNRADQLTPNVTTNSLKGSAGILTWALALCGQRVSAPAETSVWSFPGQETSVILANLPAFLAQMPIKPGTIIVECGTNNMSHDALGTGVGSVASITADWMAIAAYLQRQGIRTIFIPILPRIGGAGYFSTTAFTLAQYDVIDRCNRWLNRFAHRSGGWVSAATACLPDITVPTGVGAQPKTDYFQDGSHPGLTAGYYIGKAVAAILRLWFPPLDLLPTNNLVYDPTAPYGNMIQNPMLAGSGGGINAPASGTLSGTAPNNWNMSMSNTAGLTIAGSQVTSALTGLPMHQFSLSGAYTPAAGGVGTQAFARLYCTPLAATVAGINPGDTVEALMAFEIDAGANCIQEPSLQMRWNGSGNYHSDMYPTSKEGVLPSEAINGVLRTPAYTYAANPGAGNVQLHAYIYLRDYPAASFNPTGVMRIGRMCLQKVE